MICFKKFNKTVVEFSEKIYRKKHQNKIVKIFTWISNLNKHLLEFYNFYKKKKYFSFSFYTTSVLNVKIIIKKIIKMTQVQKKNLK